MERHVAEPVPSTLLHREFSLAQFSHARPLAQRLTELKRLASRHPDEVKPVTVTDLHRLDEGRHSQHLFLQCHTALATENIVGMLVITVLPLSDGAHLGPLVVDTTSQPRGHGTALLEYGHTVVKDRHSDLRYITLTTHPTRGLAIWYEKHGYVTYDTNVMRRRF